VWVPQIHHRVVLPVALEVILAGDPSEAVRSRGMLPTCKEAGFSILGYAGRRAAPASQTFPPSAREGS